MDAYTRVAGGDTKNPPDVKAHLRPVIAVWRPQALRLHIFSYRYAQEVLQHNNYSAAWDELTDVLTGTPVFIWSGKSAKVKRLCVVQQLLNTYFDRRLAIDLGWEYHPLATNIAGSELRADFRKSFGNLGIQVEIQFGNMARWYSDIFKFQAGYSAGAIQLGVSVVPMQRLATLIDQNIVNFERAKRELPSAELSITLPILMIGLEWDEQTKVVDARTTQFADFGDLAGRGNGNNRWRVVHAYLNGVDMATVGPAAPTGPMGAPADIDDDLN